MKSDFTTKEFRILYTLLNDHLNTIGGIATYLNPRVIAEKKGYLWEMEKLELKLATKTFGLKPK